MDDGFTMPFRAHLKKIELDAEGIVRPLMKEVRKFAEMENAPGSKEGCKDCEILGQVVGLVAGGMR